MLLINPPLFDADVFPDEAVAPEEYCSLALETINSLIVPGYEDDPKENTPVSIQGVELSVHSCQFDNNSEYPVLFVLQGRAQEYTITIWADRLTIEIDAPGEPTQVKFPQTEEELSNLLSSIVSDCA